jgi:hypothetical protein
MKLIFTCGVMFSFLFGCSSLSYQSPRYVKLAAEITEKTAQKLKGKKNLYLVGTGGGMMNDIQAMHMSFHFYQEVDLKEARELVVYAANEYLLDINNNEEIRPYLHEYPFTAQNVEVVVFFYNPDGSKVASGKIKVAAVKQGKVVYYIDYPEKYTLKSIYEEPYEEALQAISF